MSCNNCKFGHEMYDMKKCTKCNRWLCVNCYNNRHSICGIGVRI